MRKERGEDRKREEREERTKREEREERTVCALAVENRSSKWDGVRNASCTNTGHACKHRTRLQSYLGLGLAKVSPSTRSRAS